MERVGGGIDGWNQLCDDNVTLILIHSVLTAIFPRDSGFCWS